MNKPLPLSKSFGFQNVDEHEREQRIRRVFEAVAKRYDLMNDLMSFGIHRAARRPAYR
jgi:demethylmenaquinone methyltransferase / 2-methoxy-6-polyprenyl-1,4-benzoquinol methylase